ncbi:hypothetical protein ACFL2Q_12695 [Thermodesulfobacteriota bacterium]
MNKVRRFFFLAIVAGFLFLSPPTRADIGPVDVLKGGGTAAPKSPHETIRLDSQEVIIRLRSSGYTVDAVYHLFNTGQSIIQWTGFPMDIVFRGIPFPTSSFSRFEAWINGRQVEFTEQLDFSKQTQRLMTRFFSALSRWFPNSKRSDRIIDLGRLAGPLKKERRWLVHRVRFPAQSGTTIRVRYEAPYNSLRSSRTEEAVYLYGTGALWKERIGKAVFIVDSSHVGRGDKFWAHWPMILGGRRISEDLVKYEMWDFEPEQEDQFTVFYKSGLRQDQSYWGSITGVR